MTEKKQLNVGDKYLKALIDFGGQKFEFVAFLNEEANEENKQPNFRGRNIGIWINTKKEPEEQKQVMVEDIL